MNSRIIIILILLTGLCFRTHDIIGRFEFAHDGDLYSWIVKDIVVDHHFRLIGQLTSAPGIFIGPLFYYLLIPFFVLTNMDPVGALIPVTILGLLTIFSYYFVLRKLFNNEAGLIGAFLYAVLWVSVNQDRWVVPTVTTSIWSIWYFYCLVKISRKDFSVLPLLGALVGLIWHIHIALIPSLVAVPIAFIVSKKLPSLKQSSKFILWLLIFSIPLILFEARHNFQQTTSFVQNFINPHSGPTGLYKFNQVLGMITQNTNSLFFAPQSFDQAKNIFFPILILLLPLIFVKSKLISNKDLLPLYFWVLGIILFFSLSSSPISEYYFSNIQVIFISLISLVFAQIFRRGKIFSYIILGLLLFVAAKNIYFFTSEYVYHKGYVERKNIVQIIKKDTMDKNYPCVGISYITAPGESVGFRYLLYLNNIKTNRPSLDIPVYNIVIPDELSPEVEKKFGHIGIILPKGNFSKETLDINCEDQNLNLSDSMFGFVK